MGSQTGIEWTDATWNPVSGCDEVSSGCKFCYAKTIAERYAGTAAFPNGFALTFHPERLEKPLHWRAPRRVFVNSMSDLFHEGVPDDYIARVFAVIERAPQHTFQILTKRPERMADWTRGYGRWPDNAWAGTSIESQLTAHRLTYLGEVDARVRFISAEPLLGPLVLLGLEQIAWLIVGGESGSHFWEGGRMADRRFLVARDGTRDGRAQFAPKPAAIAWVRDLREQARSAGTAFFFKQWGGPTPKAAGALLDGDAYAEYPHGHLEDRAAA